VFCGDLRYSGRVSAIGQAPEDRINLSMVSKILNEYSYPRSVELQLHYVWNAVELVLEPPCSYPSRRLILKISKKNIICG